VQNIKTQDSVDPNLDDDTLWANWMRKHHKRYPNAAQEANARANFIKHLEIIRQHNQNSNRNFTLGLNHLSDIPHHRFVQRNGHRPGNLIPVDNSSSRKRSIERDLSHEEIVSSSSVNQVSWVDAGMVSEIKDQGQCGCCYAFATAAAIESQFMINGYLSNSNSVWTDVSPQQLMDCSFNIQNYWTSDLVVLGGVTYYMDCGASNYYCEGGSALCIYIALKHQVPWSTVYLWPFYPYVESNFAYGASNNAPNNGCMTPPQGGELNFFELFNWYYQRAPDFSEDSLVAIVNGGPVVLTIYASDPAFQSYSGGVYYPSPYECEPNHAVLVVGYGTDPNYGDYWLIKNSWGTWWGEGGYFRYQRGGNPCMTAPNVDITYIR